MIEVKKVSKTFYLEKGLFLSRGESKEACREVSLKVEKGEIVSIVGESGSGKSTLAKIMTGLLTPESGSVLIDGIPLEKYPPALRASKIGIVFQDPSESLNPMQKSGSVIEEALLNRSESGEKLPPELSSVENIFSEFSIDIKLASSKPGQLSGGQRQRLAVARSFTMFPSCLVLDEVTSSLDVSTTASMIKLFKNLNRRYGTAMIFITHDLVLADIISERIYVMKEGAVVESGQTQEVFCRPKSGYVRSLREALI